MADRASLALRDAATAVATACRRAAAARSAARRARTSARARAAHRRLEAHRCHSRRATRQEKPRGEARLPLLGLLRGLGLALEGADLVNDRAPPDLGLPAWRGGKLAGCLSTLA